MFPQDITEMRDELPLRKESVLTFILYLGNKLTEEVLVKQLKVRKDYVSSVLKWLQHHHTGYGYTDIRIIEEFFSGWMTRTNSIS